MAQAKKRYKVLVLFGSAGTPPANQDFTKELKTEDFAAEAHVIEALKTVGHEVRTLGVWDEASLIIDEIKANPPDVVFNLTEHFNEVSAYDRNGRSRRSGARDERRCPVGGGEGIHQYRLHQGECK
jgi:hypothetical protein